MNSSRRAALVGPLLRANACERRRECWSVPRWTRSAGRKRSLSLPSCCPRRRRRASAGRWREARRAPLICWPRAETKDLELEHAVVVVVNVLRDFVDHDEEGLVLRAAGHHGVDGVDDLVRGGPGPCARARLAVDPARRLEVALGVHLVHDVREVVVGLLVVLGDAPSPCPAWSSRRAGSAPSRRPFWSCSSCSATRLLFAAVAKPRLHLAQDRAVDVLVVAGHAADVEDNGDGIERGTGLGSGK